MKLTIPSRYVFLPPALRLTIGRNPGTFSLGFDFHYGGALNRDGTWIDGEAESGNFLVRWANYLFEVKLLFWSVSLEVTIPYNVKPIDWDLNP